MLRLRSATAVIALVTVAISAFILLFTNVGVAAALWGFTPAAVGADLGSAPAIPWWLTPFSAELLHGSWLHLFVNMLMLVLLGSQVERVIGGAGLLFAYIAGALTAAAAQYAVDPSSTIPMIGASGAISALFGLYALFYGRPKQVSRNMKLNRWIHAAWLLAAWVVVQWMLGLLVGLNGLLQLLAGIGLAFIIGMAMQKPLLLWRYRGA